MAGKASNIKASEAYVTIRADQGNLPNTIEQARASMKSFAAQVGGLGQKVGGKFTDAIAKGAIGFAAVSAVDGIFRDLAKEMEQQADAGGIDFSGLGVAVVKSLKDTFEGLPLIGALVPLSEQIWDLILGSPMAAERRLAQVAEERRKLQGILDDVAKQVAKYDDEYATKGDAAKGSRAAAFEAATEAANRLVEAGMSVADARAAAAEITSAFERLTFAKADEALGEINYQLDVLSGSVPESVQELKRFEKELERVAGMFEAAGQSPEWAKEETDRVLARFKQIQAGKAAEEAARREAERIGEITAVIDSLRDSILEANTDESFRIRLRLEDLGATSEQIQQAVDLIEQLDRLNQEQKVAQESAKRGEEVASMVRELQTEADKQALGERGFLERQLRDMQATQEQVTTALALFDQVNGGGFESSFMGTFSAGALDGGNQFGGIEDSTRETAKNTRRMAQAMERNQLTYGS